VEWIHLGQSYGRPISCPESPNGPLDSIFLGLLSDYELLNNNATARSQYSVNPHFSFVLRVSSSFCCSIVLQPDAWF